MSALETSAYVSVLTSSETLRNVLSDHERHHVSFERYEGSF